MSLRGIIISGGKVIVFIKSFYCDFWNAVLEKRHQLFFNIYFASCWMVLLCTFHRLWLASTAHSGITLCFNIGKSRNQSERVAFKTLRFNVETCSLNHLPNTFLAIHIHHGLYCFSSRFRSRRHRLPSTSIHPNGAILHFVYRPHAHPIYMPKQPYTRSVHFIVKSVSFQICSPLNNMKKPKRLRLSNFDELEKSGWIKMCSNLSVSRAPVCFSYSLNVAGDMRWSEFQVSWLLHSWWCDRSVWLRFFVLLPETVISKF